MRKVSSTFGQCQLTNLFLMIHGDKFDVKFPPGSLVNYISLKFLHSNDMWNFIGREFKVLAANPSGAETEYLLEGFPWLVYEHEIVSALGRVKDLPSEN